MKIKDTEISDYVYSQVDKLSVSRSKASSLVQRANIIKLACQNMSIKDISKKVNLERRNVGKWRKRFILALPQMNELAENKQYKKCKQLLIETLSDKQRSGRPSKFSKQDIDTVISVACTKPEAWDWPLSQWSHASLAMFLTESNKVPDISMSSVQRILKNHKLRPHKWEMWIQPTDKSYDPYTYLKQARQCSSLLENAQQLYEQGIQIISIDEKPGIQILKPLHEDMTALPGLNPKRELFYKRMGRRDLIQGFNVATGELLKPFLSDHHREIEFVQCLDQCIQLQLKETPNDQIIILCDNLSTHKSEGVVRLISRYLKDNPFNLGIKGRSGILKNMKTREEYLTDENHAIRFIYTPRHASWLNPVECYFSIINRNLLSHFYPESPDKLDEAILKYYYWYNEHFARPFDYQFKGFEEKLEKFEKQLSQEEN